MGQAVQTDGAFGDTGRFFRLDPEALPVRHGDRSDAFILDRDRAVVRRTLGGAWAVATLDLPVKAYRGVAVRMFAEGEEGNLRVVVELLHRDPALCLPLLVADEPAEAAADWIAWGQILKMPLLFIDQDGTVSYPAGKPGGLFGCTSGQRRGGVPFRGRRSRFARRRKAGTHHTLERIAVDEIIAPE